MATYVPEDLDISNMDIVFKQVCMMSTGANTEDNSECIIKQEEEFCSQQEHITSCPQQDNKFTALTRAPTQACASPSTTVLYSPSTTTVQASEFDYNDCAEDMVLSPRIKRYKEQPSSPSSPERQFCSSTTSADHLLPSPDALKEEDAPKRLCLVCGDSASGFHYGVASCEACKAFFKRTIQGNIEYNCPATNDCEINKRRRKACQACRFHKCLRVGMLKEGVRLDRVRGGRQKYRRTSDSPFSFNQSGMRKTSLDDIKLLCELQACEPDLLSMPSVQVMCDPEYVTLATLAEIYDMELVSTIGWAKQMPGFSTLGLNDQMRLLQSTWAEILTLSLAFRSIPASARTLRYTHGFTIDEKQARECNASDVFLHIMGVVDRLEASDIRKEEFLLMKALVLTNSDVRVQDSQALGRLRQSILEALHETAFSLVQQNNPSHVQSLLLCLPSLRAADTALRRFWIGVKNEGNITLKKLFLEMLESHSR